MLEQYNIETFFKGDDPRERFGPECFNKNFFLGFGR
jgi:hypothetical protein